MQAKFRREYPFGKQRFRGLAVMMRADGVKVTHQCDQTRGTKDAALADARELVAELQA